MREKLITHSHIYCMKVNGENISHLIHTLSRIYLASILYVQCFQAAPHNSDEKMAYGGPPLPSTGCAVPDVGITYFSMKFFHVWYTVSAFSYLLRMFLSTDLLLHKWNEHVARSPLYIRLPNLTKDHHQECSMLSNWFSFWCFIHRWTTFLHCLKCILRLRPTSYWKMILWITAN